MKFSRVPIRSVATISSGKRPPEVTKERTAELAIPVIGGGGPSGFTSRPLAEKGVLITGRVGTLGKLHVAREDCWPSDNALILRPSNESFDNRFLRYALSEVIGDAVGLNRGAANPLLTQTDLGQLEIAAPSFAAQREIAATLGALDDKIELNRKTAATLEEMARALYRSWFLDFDPVHAKAEGRAPAHMEARTAALFPDRFGEDGLPDGWIQGIMSDLGKVVTGKTPSTKNPENFGDFCPFIKIPDMHGKMYVTQPSTYLSEIGANSQRNQLLPAGSVSVSCIATPGLVILNHRPAQTNQQINSVKPSRSFSSDFLYWTCVQASQEVMLGGSGGSVFQNMNKSTFAAIPIILGSDEVRKAFSERVALLHMKILTIEEENQTLATLRDTLLPRLMSGELRVGEAKEQIEAVA